MNEKIPVYKPPVEQHKSPEQTYTPLTEEEEAEAQAQLKKYPEQTSAPESPRDCEPEIKEFERMIDLFETMYSLEALHAITDLTPEQAPDHPIRQPAKIALEPIVALLNRLEEETNISGSRYAEMKAKYKRLSRAVGMINKNKVYHDR